MKLILDSIEHDFYFKDGVLCFKKKDFDTCHGGFDIHESVYDYISNCEYLDVKYLDVKNLTGIVYEGIMFLTFETRRIEYNDENQYEDLDGKKCVVVLKINLNEGCFVEPSELVYENKYNPQFVIEGDDLMIDMIGIEQNKNVNTGKVYDMEYSYGVVRHRHLNEDFMTLKKGDPIYLIHNYLYAEKFILAYDYKEILNNNLKFTAFDIDDEPCEFEMFGVDGKNYWCSSFIDMLEKLDYNVQWSIKNGEPK